MKKLTALVLSLVLALPLSGCGQTEEKQQGDYKVQYFFSGKVVETAEEYLLIEVNDTGNSSLSDGDEVEVSTQVVSAEGCPALEAGEYAKVLLEKNTDGNPSGRLETVSIYEIDETGRSIAD